MGEPHLYSVDPKGSVTPPAPPSGPPEAPNPPRRSAPKARPSHPVPTDRMKFDTQVQALRTICSASRNGEVEVTADDMGNLMGVLPVTAVLNNAFFVSVRLIEKVGRGSYKPAPIALDFQRKWTFNKAEAPKVLAPAFVDSWFFDAIKTKLDLENGEASRADLIEVLAGVANTDDSYATQYSFLLDWLEYVGLITADNGVVRLTGSNTAVPAPAADNVIDPPQPPRTDEPVVTPPSDDERVSTRVAASTGAVVSMSIDLTLTADDLARLTPAQITTLFEGIGKVAAIKDALRS